MEWCGGQILHARSLGMVSDDQRWFARLDMRRKFVKIGPESQLLRIPHWGRMKETPSASLLRDTEICGCGSVQGWYSILSPNISEYICPISASLSAPVSESEARPCDTSCAKAAPNGFYPLALTPSPTAIGNSTIFLEFKGTWEAS
jgi:hypothetical protein